MSNSEIIFEDTVHSRQKVHHRRNLRQSRFCPLWTGSRVVSTVDNLLEVEAAHLRIGPATCSLVVSIHGRMEGWG